MSLTAIFFLMIITPILALVLAYLGLLSLQSNLISWFLFFIASTYAVSFTTIPIIRFQRVKEKSVRISGNGNLSLDPNRTPMKSLLANAIKKYAELVELDEELLSLFSPVFITPEAKRRGARPSEGLDRKVSKFTYSFPISNASIYAI